MKQTLTSKENLFCELIAKGQSQTQAYKTAYECKNSKQETIKNNAYKLMNKENIKNRLAELKQIQEQECKYTKEQSYKKLCEMQEKAEQENNINAMIRAEELKGKLFDLYNNKTDINLKADIKQKTTIENIKSFRIIYQIDESILKDLIKGNEKNEYVKLIVANLKRADTAIITNKQYEQISKEEKEQNGEVLTIPFSVRLDEPDSTGKQTIIKADIEDSRA